MRTLRTIPTAFGALLLAVSILVLTPTTAKASEPITVDAFDAITTATLSVTSSGFEAIDIATPLGLNASTMQRAVRDKSMIVEVFVQDDGTENVTKAHVKFFATLPTSGDLDASTTAKTGYVIQEGQRVRFRVTGRYLAIAGLANTSKISVVRVRSD